MSADLSAIATAASSFGPVQTLDAHALLDALVSTDSHVFEAGDWGPHDNEQEDAIGVLTIDRVSEDGRSRLRLRIVCAWDLDCGGGHDLESARLLRYPQRGVDLDPGVIELTEQEREMVRDYCGEGKAWAEAQAEGEAQ